MRRPVLTQPMIDEAERIIKSDLFVLFISAMMDGLAAKLAQIPPNDTEGILAAHREIYAWQEFHQFLQGMVNDDKLREYFMNNVDENNEKIVVN